LPFHPAGFRCRQTPGGDARRHEFLALDDEEHIEHVRVEHLPGAQLLLDHVVAGLLEVHDIS
jgi:hypothetical protein